MSSLCLYEIRINAFTAVLSRRTKSNPVLIGPPGVGKTAILEGLASRIVAKEVPESLFNKRVLSLDLASIVAGSGIRGQFESKFKALLRDIEEEEGNIICFIDELLDEYRKHIEKDAALERRFQPVVIEEPTVESTISILRGLKPRYEVHHGVEVSDGALVTAAVYSSRYISDRFLPDKAIDLMDEAASALRLAQESKPDELEALDREVVTLQIELESLKNETDVYSVERRCDVEKALKAKKEEAARLDEIWQAERARLRNIKETKRRLEEAKHELEVAQRQGQYDTASRLRYAVIPELEARLPKEKDHEQEDGVVDGITMLHDRVTSSDIARVVAKATGVPVQALLKGEREKLAHMENSLRERIVGQDDAVRAVSNAVKISRAGLANPNRPVASFLFLGPTGVGKTELCKALAAFLFNDERRGLNLGSELLADPSSMGSNGSVTQAIKDAVLDVTAHHFPPELINRLDSQIVFNRLSRQNISDIVNLRLNDVAERIRDRRMHLDIDNASKEYLAAAGYSDVYGARSIARVIRQKLVNPLAEKMLVGTIRTAPDGKDLLITDNHPAQNDMP
ncbi:hypothetical protein Clacol_005952 [Clathrus columnatus]|uniref:Uncharacterized protein n=1 Tax=Clathrus columnatus TaxID=1419009 RepID=A0AAV5ABJ5_9AGAM|nr:hypothetical protein Clacol_005952 [Clathrus columnatus]